MEINPTDKLNELLDMLRFEKVDIHKSTDSGYDYLDENSICVTVSNPYSDNHLEIDLEYQGEFTVFFSGNHCHYFGKDYDFDAMCNDIKNILENKKCSAVLNYGDEKKWLGSRFIDSSSIDEPISELFDFVLKHKEFSDKIKASGGQVQFNFWNPSLNKTIDISPGKAL